MFCDHKAIFEVYHNDQQFRLLSAIGNRKTVVNGLSKKEIDNLCNRSLKSGNSGDLLSGASVVSSKPKFLSCFLSALFSLGLCC